eukprot:Gb_28830 [translate_table: standard]
MFQALLRRCFLARSLAFASVQDREEETPRWSVTGMKVQSAALSLICHLPSMLINILEEDALKLYTITSNGLSIEGAVVKVGETRNDRDDEVLLSDLSRVKTQEGISVKKTGGTCHWNAPYRRYYRSYSRLALCTDSELPMGDTRLCNNCYKQGHIAAQFTDTKTVSKGTCNGRDRFSGYKQMNIDDSGNDYSFSELLIASGKDNYALATNTSVSKDHINGVACVYLWGKFLYLLGSRLGEEDEHGHLGQEDEQRSGIHINQKFTNLPEKVRAAAFDMEYGHWVEEQNRQICELRAALQAHVTDIELRILVEGGMAHYNELFRMKSVAAKSDVFHLVSGMWKTPAERCFMWMGGFRPSELLKVIYNSNIHRF